MTTQNHSNRNLNGGIKIRLVSTADAGGAGIAAKRITTALHLAGADVKLLVANKSGEDSFVETLQKDARAHNRWLRLWRNRRERQILRQVQASRPIEHPVFSMPWGEYEEDLLSKIQDADIVHLHWVAGLFNIKSFLRRIPERCTVFWTLHDMQPLTGGYHYQNSLDEIHMTPWERRVLRQRRQAIQAIRSRVICCAPSHWLSNLASRSPVFSGTRHAVIRNCVDTDLFSPSDKAIAKRFLGIDPTLPVLLFVNHNNDDPNKGLGLLLESIEILRSRGMQFQCLTVGKNGRNRPGWFHLGSITEESLLARIYSAADLFLIPSAMDNYPNTVVEAFACGVPAIGFNIGGIPEQIIGGQTGQVVEKRTALNFADGIEKTLKTSDLAALGRGARAYAKQHNLPATIAKEHLTLYHHCHFSSSQNPSE